MDVREKLVELMDASRQYVIDTCQKNHFECDNCVGKVYDNECGEFLKAGYLIAHGVTVQEWISVSKQKPEENKNVRFYVDGNLTFTTVLASGEEKGVRMANRVNVKPCGIHYLDEHATNGWEWSVGNEDVTHWMPLPQPPKGE